MLLRNVVVLTTLASSLAWADPESVRPADYYAALDPAVVKRPPSANPLAPLPGSEQTARLTATPPTPEARPRRWGMFGAGLTLFAVGYAADAGLTYGMNHASPGTSLIPIAGPLLQIGQKYSVVSTPATTGDASVDAMTKSAADDANHVAKALVTTGLVIDFAMQLAGVAMAIAGPLSHRGPDPKKVQVSPAGLRVTF